MKEQKATLSQSNEIYCENYWDNQRILITIRWLKMTNANIIKIWEI